MKPRFEPDVPAGEDENASTNLIDPEAYDASEQRFAASLEQTASGGQPRSVVRRFIVEDEASESTHDIKRETPSGASEMQAETSGIAAPIPAEAELQAVVDPDSWRREVAERLNHYRARRRTREPRYPSLQLKFDPDPISSAVPAAMEPPSSSVLTTGESVDYVHSAAAPRITLAEPVKMPRIVPAAVPETKAKIIEFASYAPAPRALDELAEPVLDRPRIIEAPELAFPPPALGGILIEPVEEPEAERRPGFEIPLQAAPMRRRMAASAIDFALVMSAFAAFAYVFYRFAAEVPPLAKIAAASVLLLGALWSAYQYLLLVYSGTTPGLKLAKLELHHFDGSPVRLRVRRWRVLTSMLSGLSLGLGYAWCFLDEDRLCWHDRITRTYMAPAPPRTM